MRHSHELEFPFEELPLFIDGAAEGGLINGQAMIRYYADGEWFVRDIAVESWSPVADTANHERALMPIDDRSSWPFLVIDDRLTSGRWRDAVQAKVDAALAEENISAPTDRLQHSTHYRAYSGV